MQKTILLPSCWFSFALLLASSQFLQPGNTKSCQKQVPGTGAVPMVSMTVLQYWAMAWSPPSVGGASEKRYFLKIIFIFFKISTQELLNSAQQLLEIHQKNQARPSSAGVRAGNPIPSGGGRRSRGCYEDCRKLSCSHSWGNRDAGPSPSSRHLECICVISSPTSPDGQMPGTGNGVVCWCKCHQLSWLWERSQKAGKDTFCPIQQQ